MVMMTMWGWAFFLLAMLAAVLPDILKMHARYKITLTVHRVVCVALLTVGCAVRLWRLASLPIGLSAEEALVGVQAKALWQTGGFLFGGRLTAQFTQWAGETSGPLLATLTAPFVGLGGMNPLMTRLPLALLSCAAMPAAYALGVELSGRRAGRWCLTAYALCPYFVLTARMTHGANAAICLLPIALWLLAMGMKKPAAFYTGTMLLALMAYTQNMYFFISPIGVLLAGATAAAYGMKKRHAFGAALLGIVICVPAILTAFVNLTGREGFVLLGVVDIPRLEAFDKADWLYKCAVESNLGMLTQRKFFDVIIGGVFQIVMHGQMYNALFAPDGMLALYAISVPLMLLGAASLIARRAAGRRVRHEVAAARMMVILIAFTTLCMLTLFAKKDLFSVSGETTVFDLSSLFLFDVLLMAAGLCRLEHRSETGIVTVTALFAVSFAMLISHLTGISYYYGSNVYFDGFGSAAVYASQMQRETGTKVNVGSIEPHIQPVESAEFMYLYAIDADMCEVSNMRGIAYEVCELKDLQAPDTEQIYITRRDYTGKWPRKGFEYRAMADGFELLIPSSALMD